MTAPRIAVLMAATGLALAACGSGSDSAPVTQPAAVDAPADDAVQATDDFTEADTSSEPAADAPAEADEPEAVSDPPPTEPASSEPASTEAGDEPPAEEPPATDAPVEAPAEPVLGGRTLAPDLQASAQFDGNPFPDLTVDDVGKGTRVNVANILPSDRPVLLWAFAPH